MGGFSTCMAMCGSGLLQPSAALAWTGAAAGSTAPGTARLAAGAGGFRATSTSASASSPRICEPARASRRAERVHGERPGGCPARDARVRGSEKRQSASHCEE